MNWGIEDIPLDTWEAVIDTIHQDMADQRPVGPFLLELFKTSDWNVIEAICHEEIFKKKILSL